MCVFFFHCSNHIVYQTAAAKVANDEENDDNVSKKYPMFYCPNCKTEQRDFINFATAAGLYDSPQGYLALYFAMYL